MTFIFFKYEKRVVHIEPITTVANFISHSYILSQNQDNK